MSEQILHNILAELKEIREEQKGMKKELEGVKTEQQKTNERLEGLEAKQHIIYEQTGKLTERHEETMSRFDELATKEDLAYFDQKISKHEREIFNIKNRA